MEDKKLRQNIIAALDWDPSVDSANVGVAVNNGVAVLTGHVANYAQRFSAEAIAKRIKGVMGVANDIEVRFPGSHVCTDEDLAARAVQSLRWDVAVPSEQVQISVTKGWVTLSGQVEWDYQRRAAEADVRRLAGVAGVLNQITLHPRVTPKDISRRIEEALKRDAGVEASRVHVSVNDATVTLEGKVHSWHERDAVERAVWGAPGVGAIRDKVLIG